MDEGGSMGERLKGKVALVTRGLGRARLGQWQGGGRAIRA
jgi:hypothetical protein